jgi:hypothetical protein
VPPRLQRLDQRLPDPAADEGAVDEHEPGHQALPSIRPLKNSVSAGWSWQSSR